MPKLPIFPTQIGDQWVLIELQGSIGCDRASFDGEELGELKYDKGTPVMVIGHHLLRGKEIPLKKPFAVLKKLGADVAADELSPRTSRADATFNILAIIKKKIMFNSRPHALINPASRGLSTRASRCRRPCRFFVTPCPQPCAGSSCISLDADTDLASTVSSVAPK